MVGSESRRARQLIQHHDGLPEARGNPRANLGSIRTSYCHAESWKYFRVGVRRLSLATARWLRGGFQRWGRIVPCPSGMSMTQVSGAVRSDAAAGACAGGIGRLSRSGSYGRTWAHGLTQARLDRYSWSSPADSEAPMHSRLPAPSAHRRLRVLQPVRTRTVRAGLVLPTDSSPWHRVSFGRSRSMYWSPPMGRRRHARGSKGPASHALCGSSRERRSPRRPWPASHLRLTSKFSMLPMI